MEFQGSDFRPVNFRHCLAFRSPFIQDLAQLTNNIIDGRHLAPVDDVVCIDLDYAISDHPDVGDRDT